MKAQCPECDSWIEVPNSAELWDTLICPRCHTELQLISERPPELDYADFEDDYDDDYDDYDDDDDDDDDDDY
jgi:lysine biosynthesis protein LysW